MSAQRVRVVLSRIRRRERRSKKTTSCYTYSQHDLQAMAAFLAMWPQQLLQSSIAIGPTRGTQGANGDRRLQGGGNRTGRRGTPTREDE